ncbi:MULTISPECIES: hypothetical protein [unclassified Pantoea]|uniref:hypothetical protein n=1 Tax=unclassified Pantoea TaxID=2630326 RepID=UPI002269D374|nr:MULTISPECIES: hypothetical protein [unclassified Pantoea]
MSGSWPSPTESDNEGSISANEWLENDDQITMDLNVYNGKFDGVISTPAIRNFIRATPQITDYFLLKGYKQPLEIRALDMSMQLLWVKNIYLQLLT